MQEPNNFFLNRFLKWGVIATLLIIYFVTYKDTVSEKVSEKLEEIERERVEEAPSDIVVPKVNIIVKNEKEGVPIESTVVDGVVQNIVNNISKTETGRKVLRSLSEQAVEGEREGQPTSSRLLAMNVQNANDIFYADVTRGYGNRVSCSATVKYDYRGYLPGNIKFASSYKPEHVPVSLKMGKRQVVPGLEQGLIGMQEGGRRKISVPPSLGYNVPGFEQHGVGKNKIIQYDVEMRHVENGVAPLPADTKNYNLKQLTGGNISDFVECGEVITLRYLLRSGPRMDEKRHVFTLGDGSVPLGMEEAMVGLRRGASYRIELPKAWQKIRAEASPLKAILAANKKHPAIVEFTIVSID